MFHLAFFNSIIDKHQHMHFFTFKTVLVLNVNFNFVFGPCIFIIEGRTDQRNAQINLSLIN